MSTCLLALISCGMHLYVCTDVMTHFAFVVIHACLLLFFFLFSLFFFMSFTYYAYMLSLLFSFFVILWWDYDILRISNLPVSTSRSGTE
jgi:hypothetical protein